MYNVTQVFKDAIKLNGRDFRATVTIRDNNIFYDSNIIDITMNEDVNPSDSFMIGSVASNKIEATLIDIPEGLVLDGAKILPTIGLNTGVGYEDVPLGVFWIDEIKKNNNTVKITAFDSMIKLEKAYFSALSYPASINSVVNEICNKAGVELATALPDLQINRIEGYTYREAVGFISSYLGCFAKFNRFGKLEITSYKDTDTTITSDLYVKNPINAERSFSIGKISCKVGDSILSSGTGINEIQIENPIMTQSQLDSIYNILKNFSYMPFDMEWKGNHALQAGDKISIVDTNGNSYVTLLMQNQITYNGSIAGKASAKANTGQKQEFNSNGTIKNTVDRMVVEQANIRSLLAESATIENLNVANARIDSLVANAATISQLNASNVRIANLEVNSATIAQLNAVKASIDTLNVNKANITDLTATNGRISNLESTTASINTLLAGNLSAANMQAGFITANSGLIANGAIKDAMIISLSATKISAGSIDTGKVTIQSTSGNMQISDNTIQIKDSTRVRVQIGKDSSNDYNMYVWDSSGSLMFDATGLKASGIKTKIIRDDMVSDTANINGAKIEKESLVNQINGAISTLKASKIKLDTENQTLDVAFTSLKSTVTSQGSTITSQGTSISTIQGQISSKIWSSDITTVVNNIQVGGRNLLRNSGNFKDITRWSSYTNVSNISLATDAYYGSVITCSGSSSTARLMNSTVISLKQGVNDSYTVTLIYKTTSTTTPIIGGKFCDINGVEQNPQNAFNATTKSIVTLANGYTKLIAQIDVNVAQTNIYGMFIYIYVQVGDFTLVTIKLEQGNKSSDWSPASEDTDAQITTINTNYSTLNQTVSSISSNVGILQTTTSSLGTRVSSAESSISSLNSSILLKVATSDFNSYKTSNDSAVSSKASQTDLNTTNNNVSTLTTRVSSTESSISVLQGQIVSKVSQTDVANYIGSKGANLITNGTGSLGNNTNFSAFTYDGSDSYFSKGSFKDSTYNSTRLTDELITVDVSKTYRLSIWGKTAPYVGAHCHIGIAEYDSDNNLITADFHMYISGTLSTLTQDLKNGDTVVYLDNVDNWNNAVGSLTYKRKFIFWDYKNISGYQYAPLTYSRHTSNSDTWSDGGINVTNKTITLKSPWSGGTVSTGTKLSQGSSGGTYKYITAVNVAIPNSWTQYMGTIGGIDNTGDNVTNKFSYGTAAIKLLFLNNRDITGSTVWYSNISFGIDNASQQALDSATARISTAESNISQLSNSIILKVDTSTYNSKMSNIDGSIGYLTNRVSTTESSISILQGQIVNKVNVGDMGTLITQNAASVKTAVGQIGGNNLIKNGRGLFGTTGWSYWNNQGGNFANVSADTSWNQFKQSMLMFSNTGTNENWLIQYGIQVKPNTKYTLQFRLCVDPNVSSVDVFILGNDTNSSSYQYVHQLFGGIKSSSPQYFRATYTTGANEYWCYLRFDNNGYINSNTGYNYVMLTDIKLEEGENATAWSPNANELKNSSFEVTEDYARFTSNTGAYTEFNPTTTGLQWHQGGNTYDYFYLTASGIGQINIGQGAATITLPDTFKYKKNIVVTVTPTGMDLGTDSNGHSLLMMGYYLVGTNTGSGSNGGTPTISVGRVLWGGSVVYISYNNQTLVTMQNGKSITFQWTATC